MRGVLNPTPRNSRKMLTTNTTLLKTYKCQFTRSLATHNTHTHTHTERERDRHTQTHIYTNLKGTNDNHHTFENRTYKVSVDKVARHLTKLLRMWRLAPCVSEAAHTSHLT